MFMIWRNIYGDFERNELHCFAQPRADSAFCLYCGAACMLHVVLPRQHPDGGERGGKSGAGHPGDGAGGQPQRVAIARALASDAKVILADEPTGNLDTENGKVVIDLLKKLVKDENYCVIVVTHDPGIAAQADVVYKMQDGRLAVEC